MHSDVLADHVRPWLEDVLAEGALDGVSSVDDAPITLLQCKVGNGDPDQRVRFATVGCAARDTGLDTVLPDGRPARVAVEYVIDTHPHLADDAPRALITAAMTIAAMNGRVMPRPGTVLPDLCTRIPGWNHTVVHGLFVEPQLWSRGTPHLVLGDEPVALFVVPLQLVLLTPDEFEYALTYSSAGLLEQMDKEQVDAANWDRP